MIFRMLEYQKTLKLAVRSKNEASTRMMLFEHLSYVVLIFGIILSDVYFGLKESSCCVGQTDL